MLPESFKEGLKVGTDLNPVLVENLAEDIEQMKERHGASAVEAAIKAERMYGDN